MNKENTLHIVSHNIPFNIKIVFQSESYGFKNTLIHHEKEPIIEFYDSRYAHTDYGQFVARYCATTLLEPHSNGLNLDGGVPDWYIAKKDFQTVQQWLKEHQPLQIVLKDLPEKKLELDFSKNYSNKFKF